MFSKGDIVRCIDVSLVKAGDPYIKEKITLGKTYEVLHSLNDIHILIQCNNGTVGYVFSRRFELVEKIPYAAVINKIKQIKERRVRLGYSF